MGNVGINLIFAKEEPTQFVMLCFDESFKLPLILVLGLGYRLFTLPKSMKILTQDVCQEERYEIKIGELLNDNSVVEFCTFG